MFLLSFRLPSSPPQERGEETHLLSQKFLVLLEIVSFLSQGFEFIEGKDIPCVTGLSEREECLPVFFFFALLFRLDCAVSYLEKAVLCSVHTPLLSSVFLSNLGVAYLRARAFRRSQKTFEASLLSYRRHVRRSSSSSASFSSSLPFSRSQGFFSLLSSAPSSRFFSTKKQSGGEDDGCLDFLLLRRGSQAACRFLSFSGNRLSKGIVKKRRRLFSEERLRCIESLFSGSRRKEEEKEERWSLCGAGKQGLEGAAAERVLDFVVGLDTEVREEEEEDSTVDEEEEVGEKKRRTDSSPSSWYEDSEESEDGGETDDDAHFSFEGEGEEKQEERSQKEFLINSWLGLGIALYIQRDDRCIKALEKVRFATQCYCAIQVSLLLFFLLGPVDLLKSLVSLYHVHSHTSPCTLAFLQNACKLQIETHLPPCRLKDECGGCTDTWYTVRAWSVRTAGVPPPSSGVYRHLKHCSCLETPAPCTRTAFL